MRLVASIMRPIFVNRGSWSILNNGPLRSLWASSSASRASASTTMVRSLIMSNVRPGVPDTICYRVVGGDGKSLGARAVGDEQGT